MTEEGGPIIEGSLTVLTEGMNAARQDDMTLEGGPIIQGSRTVLIGSQGGKACSVCPGGKKVGSPVNPQLGAKVLLGAEDMDFALPGALPVVWQRQYSSYVNAEHGAACGLLGRGWRLLTELRLELRPKSVLLFDAAGRVITFEEALPPGGQQYIPSEDLWLLRGGKDPQGYPAFWSRQPRFAHVSAELAGDDQAIIATSGTADTLWVFTPAPHRDNHWQLTAQADRFGRSQRYQYSTGKASDSQRKPRKGEETPLPAGHLIVITDGAGRRYRLEQQRIHAGKDADGPWAADDGWRLSAVQLNHDPHHATPEPITLVSYGYDRQGQLTTVHDKAGQLTREFEWQSHRISAHRHRGGPWHRYQYGGEEPSLKVIKHTNEQGLDYQFQYITEEPTPEGTPRHSAIVTDSLGRTETYRFQGEGGLSRLIEHQRADSSRIRQQARKGIAKAETAQTP
jgi:YD repeat-containing protein